MKKFIKKRLALLAVLIMAVSCRNDFLDREPLSSVAPENFYRTESDLAAYTIGMYGALNSLQPGNYSLGTFTFDNHTDNQAASGASTRWAPGYWLVGPNNDNYEFGTIRSINYFINTVESRMANNEVAGIQTNINHYLGEAYFFRAYEYFRNLQNVGDFPIITTVLPDDAATLTEASKRRPRNEVARFILSDLDKAISLLKPSPVENKNRISKEVAILMKSRVGLFEGSWETYHKNTAFVPGGPEWPGATKDYLKNFSINIDNEINFFLTQSLEASKLIADKFPIVQSNHNTEGSDVFNNPYFKMFADYTMANYSEVLLWRDFEPGVASHFTQTYFNGGGNTGLTKSYVDSYLMKNGLPIYAPNSGYKGDVTISDVVTDRDERLRMFMKVPGETFSSTSVARNTEIPKILEIPEQRSVTGYEFKKGYYGDPFYLSSAQNSVNGSLVFRSTEALLNYIEAYYIKNKSLDGVATGYWRQLRTRAGLPADFNITIDATDLSQEQDWAKYSAGQLVDKTLYNIRRERRNEFLAEGQRYADLRRWRALDQVKNYQVEGFNLWDKMYTWYVDSKGASLLRAEPEKNPNVSPKANSKYLRPYQIVKANNIYYNGYNWAQAHYLAPLGARVFLLTSQNGDLNSSVVYQNPYWPIAAGGTPTK